MPVSDSSEWPAALPLPLIGPVRVLQSRAQTVSFESRRLRVRRSFDSYIEIVEFTWNFTVDEFETFKAFFEDDLFNGAFPFYITLMDPDDSSMQIVTDYVFFEGDYEISRSDALYNVAANVIVQEQAIEAIPEPFEPGLCGVVIDGSDVLAGGGTTFECYAVDEYPNDMEPAGTGIGIVRNDTSPFAQAGETFQSFAIGPLVLGSPSVGSGLTLMRYGTNLLFNQAGDDFQSYSIGALSSGTPPTATELSAYVVGDGP